MEMQRISSKEEKNPKYKSFCKLLLICMNACLSAFWVGYSLVYAGALHPGDFKPIIMDQYNLNLGDQGSSIRNTQAIVQGLIPIGAMGGALLSSVLIRNASRRNSFLITNVLSLVSILIIAYIHNPVTFIVGRLLQGVCTGIFSAIVPLYINQIVTPDAGSLGSLNQVFISGAQGFCFLWYFILIKISSDDSLIWKMLAEFPLIFLVLQTVLFWFVFPYETPKYLYEKGLRNEAIELISIIYSQEFVDEAITRFESGKSQTIISKDQVQVAVRTELIGDPNRKLSTSKLAIIFAIHIALLQQLSGVNAIVIYGKQTLEEVVKSSDAIDLLAVLNASLPAFMSVLTIKVMAIKGRKFLIQLGTAVCAVCLAMMTLAFLLKSDNSEPGGFEAYLIIVGMFVFMAIFGLTLGPVVWLYIPQIVEPNIIPFSTMTNLLGATFCIMVFPFLNNINPAWVFLLFLAWCIMSLVFNARAMVQTKDKSREKVFEQFRLKKVL